MNGFVQTSRLVDELLGEINNLQSRISNSDEQGRRNSAMLSGELETLQDKLASLEKLSSAAVPDDSGTLGSAAAALIGDLDSKIDRMQSEINDLKVCAVLLWHGVEIIKELYSIPESAV